jgi:hypothetical protein
VNQYMTTTQTIVWRCIYLNGHEYCRVYSQEGRRYLTGAAVFVRDNKPSRLEYLITCDSDWHTLSAAVTGRVGEEQIDIKILVDPDQSWRVNEVEQPALRGCIDIDLNFSPSTNLLPIRRLSLEFGQEASVEAAWLRFPSFNLERLTQSYQRVNEFTYRYESGGGSFVSELKVNSFGLVTNYPGIWEEELG